MKTELSTKRNMTTREVAETLGITPRTVQRIAKSCFPEKKIARGKKALYTNKELTIMLDRIQHGNDNQHHVTSTAPVAVATTELTPALMIKQAMELAQKGYELELKRIAAEKESLLIELDRSREWYSIKRMEKLNKGMHFDWRLLKKESERLEIEIKQVFDANYGNVNAYHIAVWESLFFDTLNYGD